MNSICGIDCSECPYNKDCCGCEKNCANRCIAAEYIKIGGRALYDEFKNTLINEINILLKSEDIPEISQLYELSGQFVNLEYTLPSGKKVKFLKDNYIYLGCQIEFADLGICYGVVADTSFILLCSYSVNGSEPEIITYKRR